MIIYVHRSSTLYLANLDVMLRFLRTRIYLRNSFFSIFRIIVFSHICFKMISCSPYSHLRLYLLPSTPPPPLQIQDFSRIMTWKTRPKFDVVCVSVYALIMPRVKMSKWAKQTPMVQGGGGQFWLVMTVENLSIFPLFPNFYWIPNFAQDEVTFKKKLLFRFIRPQKLIFLTVYTLRWIPTRIFLIWIASGWVGGWVGVKDTLRIMLPLLLSQSMVNCLLITHR